MCICQDTDVFCKKTKVNEKIVGIILEPSRRTGIVFWDCPEESGFINSPLHHTHTYTQ